MSEPVSKRDGQHALMLLAAIVLIAATAYGFGYKSGKQDADQWWQDRQYFLQERNKELANTVQGLIDGIPPKPNVWTVECDNEARTK